MTRDECRNIGNALRRMRGYVTVCWLLIALAMATQATIWALVSFTELRFAVDAGSNVNLNVVEPLRSGEIVVPGAEPDAPEAVPARATSALDQVFSDAAGISLALGTLATLIMISLMSLTVMITAATGRPGIDKVASAWVWTIVVGALTLPVYNIVQLPWEAAALMTYDALLALHETAIAKEGGLGFNPYTPLLTVTCFLGTFVVLHRFRTGVERNIPAPEPLIDPELEREATDVAASATAHTSGGRSAAAFSHIVRAEKPEKVKKPVEEDRPMTQASPGDAPKRII